jgi:hypothetical protein
VTSKIAFDVEVLPSTTDVSPTDTTGVAGASLSRIVSGRVQRHHGRVVELIRRRPSAVAAWDRRSGGRTGRRPLHPVVVGVGDVDVVGGVERHRLRKCQSVRARAEGDAARDRDAPGRARRPPLHPMVGGVGDVPIRTRDWDVHDVAGLEVGFGSAVVHWLVPSPAVVGDAISDCRRVPTRSAPLVGLAHLDTQEFSRSA